MELLDDADEDSPISYRFVFPEGPDDSNEEEQSPEVFVDEKVLVGEGGLQSECLAEVETVKQHYAAVVDQGCNSIDLLETSPNLSITYHTWSFKICLSFLVH